MNTCNCLHGQPVQDSAGNCMCIDSPVIGADGIIKYLGNIRKPLSDANASILTSFTPDPNTPIKGCGPAPLGYKYVWDGTRCNLVVDYNYSPSNATGQSLQTGSTSGAGFLDSLSNAARNNPGLALLALFGIGYTVLKGGQMKPKTREVVSTTRY